jgi:hypothetical protein
MIPSSGKKSKPRKIRNSSGHPGSRHGFTSQMLEFLMFFFLPSLLIHLKTLFKVDSVFWDKTPCSQLKSNGRFGGTFRLHVQD